MRQILKLGDFYNAVIAILTGAVVSLFFSEWNDFNFYCLAFAVFGIVLSTYLIPICRTFEECFRRKMSDNASDALEGAISDALELNYGWEKKQKGRNAIRLTFLFLLISLMVFGFFMYKSIKHNNDNDPLKKIPTIEDSIGNLNEQLKSNEIQLKELKASLDQLETLYQESAHIKP